MVMGYSANGGQVIRKDLIAGKKLAVGYRKAVVAGFFVDQVLGYEGFEAGEVVEQENRAVIDDVLFRVKLDMNGEKFFQSSEIQVYRS